jgi:oligogalacturonide lyase
MRRVRYALALLFAAVPAAALAPCAPEGSSGPKAEAPKGPPREWVEATGHRVVRLSAEPGSASFYFHQNGYTAKGDKLVINTRKGLAAVDLTTLGTKPPRVELVVEGGGGRNNAVVGKKSRQVYYTKGSTVYATHLDTRVTRTVGKLPADLGGSSSLAINADETLLASSARDLKPPEGPKKGEKAEAPPKKKGKGGGRRMALYTMSVKTGQVKVILRGAEWFNHVQFSPTDPNQLLFCHEGTWDYVERIWTIRADGTGLRKMHTRTMDHEIYGHEFFSADGKTIWYDLQTPRSKVFWLAGVSLATGERTRYKLARAHWSVHFNQSPDGKLFAGDGGGPRSVAAPGNGQWVYLFTPEPGPKVKAKGGWAEGTLKVERLVDLSKHDYRLEPNVTFTPDSKWIVFRSNLHGASHVYAVEVKRSK